MLGKSMFIILALGGSLILPMRVSAQSGAVGSSPPAGSAGAGAAAVSGVPIGPGSAGGTNNSVYDPSGVGNAPKPLQPPSSTSSSTAIANPAALPPVANRALPRPRLAATPRVRRATSTSRRAATNAVISAQDKLLDRKLTSICRGC
jgi:hypothetical protein